MYNCQYLDKSSHAIYMQLDTDSPFPATSVQQCHPQHVSLEFSYIDAKEVALFTRHVHGPQVKLVYIALTKPTMLT